MENPKQLLQSFISRNNNNPLTSKKFILEYKKEGIEYFLSLKVATKEVIVIKITDSSDNESKNELMLYGMMLENIYEGLYDRFETQTFHSIPNSKIVRIENSK